jgi:hypothetical protein
MLNFDRGPVPYGSTLGHSFSNTNQHFSPRTYTPNQKTFPKSNFTQGFYFSILSYNLSLTFTKISILLLYLRIFKTSRTRYGCYILLGIVIAYGTWLFFSSLFPCMPVAYFWDKQISGHCLPRMAVWFLNAALNIITDIAIFILPLRVVSALSLPRGQKIGLYFIFALGFLYVCHLPTEPDSSLTWYPSQSVNFC